MRTQIAGMAHVRGRAAARAALTNDALVYLGANDMALVLCLPLHAPAETVVTVCLVLVVFARRARHEAVLIARGALEPRHLVDR